MTNVTNQNTQVAVDFLHKALVEGRPDEAARLYLAADLKQHNPAVADGPEALAAAITAVVQAHPHAT
jgi:predicted SnoaL-like aldol condensation-catalyzing enzyme